MAHNLTVAYFCNCSARRLLCQTQAFSSPIRLQISSKLKRREHERRACKKEEEQEEEEGKNRKKAEPVSFQLKRHPRSLSSFVERGTLSSYFSET